MKITKKQKTIERLKLVGVTIGIFIIIVAVFSKLKINIIYLILFLVLVDLIVVIWKSLLEKKK